MKKLLNPFIRINFRLSAIGYWLVPLVFLTSCGYWQDGEEGKGKVLAEVEDARLYEGDLEEIFSEGLSKTDSIKRQETYIRNWIREKLLYFEALENLPESKKNKDKALQAYYESLIRYEYEQDMLKNYLDTAINDSAIHDFYEDNQGRFKLDRPVLKFRYMVLQGNDHPFEQLEFWFQEASPDHLDSLYYYAVTNASTYSLEDDEWKYYNEVPAGFDLPNENRTGFLQNNAFHKNVDTSGQAYVMFVKDYKIPGEIAPFALKRSNIRQILINRNKKEFLEKQEKTLYEKGIQSNKAKRYD